MAAGTHCTSNCTNQCAVACTAQTRCTRKPAVVVSAPRSAADGCRRRLVAVQRPRVRPDGELLEPALQRCAVDAHEVTAVATDHREARLVGPLVEDLLAHLAQLGGLSSCEQQWRSRSPLRPGELAVVLHVRDSCYVKHAWHSRPRYWPRPERAGLPPRRASSVLPPGRRRATR